MELVHNILTLIISPDALKALGDVWSAVLVLVVALSALIGKASLVVAALRKLIPWLKGLAEKTENKVDDAAVSGFGAFLGVVAAGLDWCKRKLEPWALDGAAKDKS